MDNNIYFDKETLTKYLEYTGKMRYALRYETNGDPNQEVKIEAAEKLSLIHYLMAHIGEHFFDYFPANYYLSKEDKIAYKDFIDDLKSAPEDVVQTLVLFEPESLAQVNYINFDDEYKEAKYEQDFDLEDDILELLLNLLSNIEEFEERLISAPIIKDKTKPSQRELEFLINKISEIQESILSFGEQNSMMIDMFQFAKLLEVYKNPLLFAWEKFKYGWHSDFWKEGDSMFEYDMFLFNAKDHLEKAIMSLERQSVFKEFEYDKEISDSLIRIYKELLKRLDNGSLTIS